MTLEPHFGRKVSFFFTAAVMALVSGCQSPKQPETQEQRVETLIDNVRLENQEQQMEATDGDLLVPGLFGTDPTYSSASE